MTTATVKQITNLFSLADIARSLGIREDTLRYHQREGYIEMPTHQKGSRLYYTIEDAEAIRRYWLGLPN